MPSARRLIASLIPGWVHVQPLGVDFAVLAEVGDRTHQEDVWTSHVEHRHACWVVCDGAGGHGGGGVAAATAAGTALQAWRLRPQATVANLAQILEQANLAVLHGQRADSAHQQMRTTVAVLAVDLAEGVLVWAHCGDSRIYAHGAPDDLAVSRDHSLVRDLLEAGLAQGDATRHHPRRNVLTAALGNRNADISCGHHVLRGNAVASFLLCTDGFWEHVDDAAIGAVLRDSAVPAATGLASLQARIHRQAPSGRDNCTGVLVHLRKA